MFSTRTSLNMHSRRRRIACAVASVALLGCTAQATAHAGTMVRRPVTDNHVRPDRPAPRVVPRKQRERFKRTDTRRRGLRTLAALDPSGRVDSQAFCRYVPGLLQMTPTGGFVNQPGYWQASTAHPYRVMPTVTGNQLVAFRITALSPNGSVPARTHWYWATATNPAGFFVQYYSNDIGGWYFQDATTGARLKRVDLGFYQGTGAGVRFTMDVAWYTNGALSRTTAINVPWDTSSNALSYCM